MNTVADLSDNVLDGAYAASFDAKDFTAAEYYGAEIRDRLTSFSSFVGGLFGIERFPKYDARTGFSQTEAARGSVGDSVSVTANNIAGVVKTGGITLAILGLAAVAVYSLARK